MADSPKPSRQQVCSEIKSDKYSATVCETPESRKGARDEVTTVGIKDIINDKLLGEITRLHDGLLFKSPASDKTKPLVGRWDIDDPKPFMTLGQRPDWAPKTRVIGGVESDLRKFLSGKDAPFAEYHNPENLNKLAKMTATVTCNAQQCKAGIWEEVAIPIFKGIGLGFLKGIAPGK